MMRFGEVDNSENVRVVLIIVGIKNLDRIQIAFHFYHNESFGLLLTFHSIQHSFSTNNNYISVFLQYLLKELLFMRVISISFALSDRNMSVSVIL